MKTQKSEINWCKFWRVSKNKTLEIQLTYWEKHWNWFNIHFGLSRCQDHAGFKLEIEVFGLYFHLWICDNRHWNIEKDDWEEVKEPMRIDITKSWIENFEIAIERFDMAEATKRIGSSALAKAELDSLKSQLETLKEQLAELQEGR